MTAAELDLAGARDGLNALGRRLDQLALSNADEPILDGLLAAMRQVHDGIIGHLSTTAGITQAIAGQRPDHRQWNLQAAA